MQPEAAKTPNPAIAAGSPGAFCCATQASNSACGLTTISIFISACDEPQYSVHWPWKFPSSVGVNHSGCVRPGTASRLPPRRGNQKEWITSLAVTWKSTVRPCGTTISFAVVRSCSG